VAHEKSFQSSEYLTVFLELHRFYTSEMKSNYSAGGSKGPRRPLGGERGVPAILPHLAAGGGRHERKKT